MDKRQPEAVETKPLNEQQAQPGIGGNDRAHMANIKRDALLGDIEYQSTRCLDRMNGLARWRDRIRFASPDTIEALWEAMYGSDTVSLRSILNLKY